MPRPKKTRKQMLAEHGDYADSLEKLNDLVSQHNQTLAEVRRVRESAGTAIETEALAMLDGTDVEGSVVTLDELERQAAVLDEAVRIQATRVEAARQEAVRRIGETVATPYRRIAKRILAAVVELNAAVREESEFVDRLPSAAVRHRAAFSLFSGGAWGGGGPLDEIEQQLNSIINTK